MRSFVRKQNSAESRASGSAVRTGSAKRQPAPGSLHLLFLQRAIGNHAVETMLRRSEAKLALAGDRRDVYEREAEQAADRVAATPHYVPVSVARRVLQPLAGPPDGLSTAAPASVREAVAAPGTPLEPALRNAMELQFGRDFSPVRLHSGEAADRSARDVNARAYAVGKHIVFREGLPRPGVLESRRLVAHELAHVVQQSAAGAARVQYDGKGPDPRQTARARVAAAMERLKKKFALAEVSEEHGAAWTEDELRRVDSAFSKMSKDEQAILKGVALVRTDRLTLEHKGREIELAGLTSGGVRIQLTGSAFRTNVTALHEAGHVIQSAAVRQLEERFRNSKFGRELESARERFESASRKVPRVFSGSAAERENLQSFAASVNKVTAAATDLIDSDERSQPERRDALAAAQSEADVDRIAVERFPGNPAARALLELHDRQREWVAAAERWTDEKAKALGGRKNLTVFVALVNKHRLARPGFAPFTPYVASFWPDKPDEFFAECYATWRNNPAYMKQYAKPLFDWFEKGGHLEAKTALEEAREKAPVITELASEFAVTFLPAIERVPELLP